MGLQRGAALLLLLALASYANRQGLAWPKFTTLARHTALEPLRLEQRLERPLLHQLASQLSSSQSAQLQTQVAAELQPLQHRLGAQQRERQRRRHEQLRERLGLPRLSIFSFEPPEGGDG